MKRFRRGIIARLQTNPPSFANVMDTKYAQAYRDLIRIAETNRLKLVLANFSMAVNARSDPDVEAFYSICSPSIHYQVGANAVHSQMVRELAKQHPGVCFVDTNPHLDGQYQNFIDLFHLKNEGSRQLAENIFNGMQDVLQEELAKPPLP